MTLYRDNARAYLASSLRELLAEAEIAGTDAEGTLKEAIDDALLAVGVAYADLPSAEIDDEDARGFLRVLKVEGLQRVRSAFVAKAYDPDVDGAVKVMYSTRVKLIDAQITEAKALAAQYVVDAADTGAWETGTIAFDYLEPA